MGLVVKTERFLPQNDDEKESRRQKSAFLTQKRRRERVSSPKYCFPRQKVVTRMGFVAKKERFSPKNGDEKESRRQKIKFPAKN